MELIDRFMARVDKSGENGCWLWTGKKNEKGFGNFHIGKRGTTAHRAAYELFVGPAPEGIRVSHTCGNYSCVNPEHLFAKTLLNRFVALVDKGRDDECWIWTGARNADGYGHIQIDNFVEKAHRLSYRLFIGNIPDGMCICHRCDNPSCVNPSHLFLGTKLDNARDREAKNRNTYLSGEKHKMAKLTSEQVESIRSTPIVKHGDKARIAMEYGVSQSCIGSILNRKTWKEI